MIYLWEKNGVLYYHTDLDAAAQLDGLTAAPDMTISEEDFYTAGGLVRLLNGEIVLGKTEAEIQTENEIATLEAEKAVLQMELDSKDYKVWQASERGQVLAEINPTLHQRREWCRSRITEIREQLKELGIEEHPALPVAP